MSPNLRLKGFIFTALFPSMLIYVLFVIVPIFWSTYYGFFNWSGIGEASFIGFSNYIEVFQDSIFWRSLKNNLVIVAASVFGQVPMALIMALILWKSTWFHKFVRASVFMPMVLSSVVIGLIWGYIYHPQIGILNAILDLVGLHDLRTAWLSDPDTAIYYLTLPIVWNYIGLYMIIFIAALQNIPSEIDDSVKLDGPGFFTRLFYIKLPLIWNTIKVAIILCISGSLKAFDLVIVMTGGGPANATELLATYMYNNTFEIYRFGYGSAVSAAILIISLLFIGGSQLMMKKKMT
jgi:raffinose/stachyose/melibiose transport system permease protein